MSHPKPSYLFFADAAAFRTWLEKHAATATELLVGYYKVGSGRPSMTWSESVDEALCFGWIDGVRRSIDEQSYCIRFTPRRPGSTWSAVNIAKVEALRAAGRMTPAGEAAYALRLAHKSAIYSYEQQQQTQAATPLPAELSAAELRLFKRDKSAWAFFNDAHPPSARKTLLHWVCSAKKAETRATRLAKLIAACAAGERLR
jgi:uncharacterized protein YdeI (YjbR/CyaY-like superfamily)